MNIIHRMSDSNDLKTLQHSLVLARAVADVKQVEDQIFQLGNPSRIPISLRRKLQELRRSVAKLQVANQEISIPQHAACVSERYNACQKGARE